MPPLPRPLTPSEWLALNAPAPPQGPSPPLPLPLPPPARIEAPRASPLALEQLYGPGSVPLLGEVVDNPEFSQEHQDLAWAILSGEKPLKQLGLEDRHLLDEVAHQMAGIKPKGWAPRKEHPDKKPKAYEPNRFDEDTSFTMGPDEDIDPDMAYSPSDSDKRG